MEKQEEIFENLIREKEKEKVKNYFEILNDINVSDKIEKIKQKEGKKDLSYLSWSYAWAELKKIHPNANYEIIKFENNLPYIFDENTGYMVFTKVTIENLTHEMWLPVMDIKNKAMKKEKYEYSTNYGKKVVESATMFDINKTIMRCLVKNLAMFGLGLYIYAGEDLPEEEINSIKEMNYNNELKKIVNEKGLNLIEIAKEYKLNSNTTNVRFKEVCEVLNARC